MASLAHLEWPFFEAGHRELAVAVDAWACANVTGAHVTDVDVACRTLVRQLGEAGWLSYAIGGRTYGGAADEIDTRALCIIRETLAQHSGLADFAFGMQGLGSGAITLFGSEEQKQSYLPRVRAGSAIAAFALSEADAGSDAAALACTAERSGDDYVLEGEKLWVSNGPIADFFLVFARTGEAPGAKGISAFIVDAGAPGVRVTERIEVMAPHSLARLAFSDCRISATQRLGEPGRGFAVAMATLDIFRTSVAAAALGFARRAFREAMKRATTRRMFGRTLSDMQLTQARLASMAIEIDAAALLTYRAAWMRDRGHRVTVEAAMAKLTSTEAAQRVIDGAMQIMGGLGVVSGETVEQLYREIRPLRIYEGATEVQQLIIARGLLKAFHESEAVHA
jgi:acyl-CoA dehydrogenase